MFVWFIIAPPLCVHQTHIPHIFLLTPTITVRMNTSNDLACCSTKYTFNAWVCTIHRQGKPNGTKTESWDGVRVGVCKWNCFVTHAATFSLIPRPSTELFISLIPRPSTELFISLIPRPSTELFISIIPRPFSLASFPDHQLSFSIPGLLTVFKNGGNFIMCLLR